MVCVVPYLLIKMTELGSPNRSGVLQSVSVKRSDAMPIALHVHNNKKHKFEKRTLDRPRHDRSSFKFICTLTFLFALLIFIEYYDKRVCVTGTILSFPLYFKYFNLFHYKNHL